MTNSLLIAKKEIKSYFTSPAAYIALFVFLIIASWFFSNPMFLIGSATLRTLFNIIPIVYIFFIPAITMSLISKEKNTGTIEVLTTFPISDSEIVWGKFLGSLTIIVAGLAFTLVHLFTIMLIGENLDFGAILGGYLGLLLMGAAYSAIGIFASSLTDNQIIAFIIGLLIVFILFIVQSTLMYLPSSIANFFRFISSGYHFSNMMKGIIDSRDLIYFGSVILIFLKLSIVKMESRKWK
ncbi:MAG: ABC transporter permease [Candidatus Cloacimonadota bacterium]|nr:ABC transporter permease [Candidatus Cloacimonadota bacterium]